MLSVAEWGVVALSLKVGLTATLVTLPVAFALAWLLARGRFPGKVVLDALIHLPLVVPPVVTGWVLLIAFGPAGPFGAPLLHWFGASVLFRWTGAFCVVLPFALRHVRADRAVLRAGWKPILLLGLTGVAAFNAFTYSGLRHTTATNGLLLQAAIPALVILFDRLLFRIGVPALQLCGVAISTRGSSHSSPREPLRTKATSRPRFCASRSTASATASASTASAAASRGT